MYNIDSHVNTAKRQLTNHPSMKLLLFGHSYVRDLSNLGILNFRVNQFDISVKYLYWPGAGYKKFLDNPSLIAEAVKYKPDIVVVILGGNSIRRDIGNHELFDHCRKFYTILRDLTPDSLIIPAQVQLRRYSREPRKLEYPQFRIFKQKRNSLNQFLKRLKLKDNLLIIAGLGRLDSVEYYKRDGVHLNAEGLRVYMAILKTTVAYAIENKYRV